MVVRPVEQGLQLPGHRLVLGHSLPETRRASEQCPIYACVGSRQCAKPCPPPTHPPRSAEELPSIEPIPAAQKFGGHCCRMSTGIQYALVDM